MSTYHSAPYQESVEASPFVPELTIPGSLVALAGGGVAGALAANEVTDVLGIKPVETQSTQPTGEAHTVMSLSPEGAAVSALVIAASMVAAVGVARRFKSSRSSRTTRTPEIG